MPPEKPKGRWGSGPVRWASRAALTVGIPLLFIAALEGGLRLAGFGRPATFLIADDKAGYLRTNPDFASLFLPGNFDLRPLNLRVAEHKAPNTFRIVVLGESAAQGIPVPSFAFAPQLRALLRARYLGKEFEVIDTGIVAVNSHVVYQIAREMARLEPDLFLVYMGNNEVVGPYGPGCAYLSAMPPLWIIRASVFVRSSRTGQLFATLLSRISARARPAAEWGGMAMFVDHAVAGDDPRLETVYANLAANLRGIVAAASGAGAKTVLCTVVANLKDCPPLLSRHSPGMSAGDLASWQAAFDRGRLAWLLGDAEKARAQLSEALRIDPRYADVLFMLGSLDLEAGDAAASRRHFIEALHWDALRFRPDPRVNQEIRAVARGAGEGVSLLDAARALGSDPDSTGVPSGREILFEHVHFDWPGNYRLARMMARSCAAAIAGPDPGDTGWLDSDACADAVGYTPHERLPMLLRIEVLVRKPPFTNQLDHADDEARLAREIDAASQAAHEPATLAKALGVARAALAGDPANPSLAGILEGIDLDLGDREGALAMSRLASGELPRDFATSADEASILMRLGRFSEAEVILDRAASSGGDLDLLAPVFAEFWTASNRVDEGRRFFGAAISRKPQDLRLRLARAGMLRASGDAAGAEGEYRSILAANPSNEESLEALVSLLTGAGRQDEAARESLASAELQPGNQNNSLRAAKASEAHGDADASVRYLVAAERSGPVNATFELSLALKLYQMHRLDEMMLHLARARRLSLGEGDPGVTESINRLIGRMGRESGALPP